jgi:hypothetical protein
MWAIEEQARQAAGGKLHGKNDIIAAWDQLHLPLAAH